MYHRHWNLRETPFRQPAARRFFHSPAHEEALARLHFLADETRHVGLLSGLPGTGKSLLLELFQSQLQRSGRDAALVGLTALQPCELLWRLAAGFGLNPEPAAGVLRLWRMLEDHFEGNRCQRRSAVVLLDDAHLGLPETLAHVLRLVQFQHTTAAALTVVLAADVEEYSNLGSRLLDLVELRIDVEPWERDVTAAYVTEALERAGAGGRAIFSEAAVLRLHEVSGGIPRRISQLADLALLAGAGQELTQIDAATIDLVHTELHVRSADPQPTPNRTQR